MEDDLAYGLNCELARIVAEGGMDLVLTSIWKTAKGCGFEPVSISVEMESEGAVRILICGGNGKMSYAFKYILPSTTPKAWGAAARLPHDPNALPWIVSAGGTDPSGNHLRRDR